MGGKERNKHKGKKLKAGRGTVGKTAVVGAKDRKTNKIKAKVVKATDTKTLQEFVVEIAANGATVYTDDAAAYKGMPFDHASVRHSVGEYVDGMAPHQWHRVVLEHAQARPQGRLPQDQRQAPTTLCGRIRRPPRRPRKRHTGPDAVRGFRDGRKAVALPGFGCWLKASRRTFASHRWEIPC